MAYCLCTMFNMCTTLQAPAPRPAASPKHLARYNNAKGWEYDMLVVRCRSMARKLSRGMRGVRWRIAPVTWVLHRICQLGGEMGIIDRGWHSGHSAEHNIQGPNKNCEHIAQVVVTPTRSGLGARVRPDPFPRP